MKETFKTRLAEPVDVLLFFVVSSYTFWVTCSKAAPEQLSSKIIMCERLRYISYLNVTNNGKRWVLFLHFDLQDIYIRFFDFVSWNDESYGLSQNEINASHFIWQCLPSSNDILRPSSDRCFICFLSPVFSFSSSLPTTDITSQLLLAIFLQFFNPDEII